MRQFIDIVANLTKVLLRETHAASGGGPLLSMKGTLSVLNAMVDDAIVDQYAIAGAVAAYHYIEPTVTDDLDVLITLPAAPGTTLINLTPIYGYLAQHGYATYRHEGVEVEGWTVQFLPVATALDAEALAQAVAVPLTLGEQRFEVRVLRPEYLVAKALAVGRPKDLTRVIQFLEEHAVDVAAVCRLVTRFNLSAGWQKILQLTNMPDPCQAKPNA